MQPITQSCLRGGGERAAVHAQSRAGKDKPDG